MTKRQRILNNVSKYNQRLLFEEYALPVTAEGAQRIVKLERILSKLIRRMKPREEQRNSQMSFDFKRKGWKLKLRQWLRV